MNHSTIFFTARHAALRRGTLAAISAVAFGSSLLLSAVAPASASASVHAALNECPLPSPAPSAIVRMITVLELGVMDMLGIAQSGCNAPE